MTTLKEIGERLAIYLQKSGIGVNEMGKKSETSGAQVSNIINGKVYGTDKLLKILNTIPEEEAYWIQTGIKNMSTFMSTSMSTFAEKQNEMIQKKYAENEVNTLAQEPSINYEPNRNKVYFIDESVRAGLVVGFTQENTKDLEPISIPWLGKGIFYVFNVRGDSMYPTLSNGDKVLAKQVMNIQYIRSGEIYVWLTDDGMVIKRYSHNELDQVILLSDNEETYSKPLIVDSKRIMGVFEIVERNTSNLGKNNSEKQQLKLYKALLESNGIKI